MRAVLDTNILVAGLQSKTGASRQVLEAFIQGQFELIYSNALLLEYEEVLTRFEDRIGLARVGRETLLNFIAQQGIPQTLYRRLRPQLRDPKDEHVLELAFNGRCPFIVTFNVKDLLPARGFGIEVISPAAFLILLGEKP